MAQQTDHIGDANKMVTAVEFLEEEYHGLCLELKALDMSTSQFNKRLSGLFEEAKAMEKEQIIYAWVATENELQRLAAEQYYNRTYGK